MKIVITVQDDKAGTVVKTFVIEEIKDRHDALNTAQVAFQTAVEHLMPASETVVVKV